MKDGIHITDIQEVPNTKIEASETFWDIVMDETGNRLTAFWPSQRKQISKTKIVKAASCSPEILTLDGCLKLQNKHQAQFNIGLIYEQGLSGVEKNSDKAYEWYQKSAAQGNQRAKFNIEYMISKKMINKYLNYVLKSLLLFSVINHFFLRKVFATQKNSISFSTTGISFCNWQLILELKLQLKKLIKITNSKFRKLQTRNFLDILV